MVKGHTKETCKNIARDLLLAQDIISPVVDVRDFKLNNNIFFASFKEYAEINDMTIENIKKCGILQDGYTIRQYGVNIILYDNEHETSCPQRLRFSLAHELGHIYLNHTKRGSYEEMQANCFASQLLAHDAIVINIIKGSFSWDLDFIRNFFGISWDTASIKLKSINMSRRAYKEKDLELWNKFATCYNNKKIIHRQKFYKPQSELFSNIIYAGFDEI